MASSTPYWIRAYPRAEASPSAAPWSQEESGSPDPRRERLPFVLSPTYSPSVRNRVTDAQQKNESGTLTTSAMPNPRAERARELFQNAYELQMQGDFELAAQFYQRSIELHPTA